MPLTPIYASPGVQLTNSPYSSGKQWGIGAGRTAMGRYSVASNVEFIAGFPQKVGGFTALISSGMVGIPRAIKSWRDVNGTIRLCIGTESHLYTCLADGTSLTDITPRNMVMRETTALTGGTPYVMGYATTSGSKTVSFSFITADGTKLSLATAALASGDYIGFNMDTTTATNAGIVAFNGVYQISNVTSGPVAFTLTNSLAASGTYSGTINANVIFYKTLLGTNPFATTSGSSTVVVTVPYAYTQGWDTNNIPTTVGRYVTFAGATTFNNVTISGEYLLTPIGTSQTTYSITAGTLANATSSGGGSAVSTTYTPAMSQYFTAPQPSTALAFTQQALPTSRNWSALCYGANGFVALATSTASGAISVNGSTWTNTTLPSSQAWSTVCYGNSMYVALVSGSSVTAYSSDGVTWTQGTLPSSAGTYITPGSGSFTDASGNIYSITVGQQLLENGIAIPTGPATQAGEYINGISYFQGSNAPYAGQWYTWNQQYFTMCSPPPSIVPAVANWSSICYGAGVFVAVATLVAGSPSAISVSSTNGTTWTQNAMPSAARWTAVVHNGISMFVAIAGSTSATTVAASSTDGITWTARTLPASAVWISVAWGGSTFCAIAGGTGASTVAATSPDGITWTARVLPSSQVWTRITYGQGYFMAVAGGSSNNVVALSIDGVTWTQQTLPTSAAWTYNAYGNGVLLALAANSTIAATSQVVVVAPAPSILPIGWNLAAYGGLMLASPIGGTIYKYDPIAGGKAVTLGNAPGHCCGMFVTPERMIVALGASQGSITDSPQIQEYITFAGSNMCVMWSDQADPTIWTSATGNTAQTGRTLQGGDYFVGGIAVRDGTSLIFTNRCCFAMTYNGNYLVYDTPLLADNAGLVSPYAVAAEGGIAVWMNDCDLYSWSGTVAAVATDDVRSTVFSNINPSYLYKAVAGFNRLKKQVKFWYPTTLSSTENDGCLIFQTDSLVFSTGTIARTGWTDSNLGSLPYGLDSLGNLYQEEVGVDANGQAIAATLTFSPTDISNGDRSVDMFGFTPDFRKQIGNLTLSINTQYYPQDPVTVTGPFTITPTDSNPQIDLRCDGKMVGWTITSNVVGGDFRMGLCRVDFLPSGARQ